MNEIINAKQRLTEIECELPDAERFAEAEAGMLAANGDAGRWGGSIRRRDDLLAEKRDLELKIRGQELKCAVDELAAIEGEIERATAERTSALETLEQAKTNPVVQRWLKSDEVANREGVGYAWQIIRPWLVSLKPKTAAPPQVGAMNLSDWPDELSFSDADRQVIHDFIVAEDAVRKADMALTNAKEKRQQLLAQHPELKAA